MKYFVAAVVISFPLAACGVRSADDLAGAWASTDSSLGSSIVLDEYGKFSVNEFPADLACSAKVGGYIDGKGKWEYQPEGDRIFLVFSSIGSPKCETPFGVMIFVHGKDELAVMPDVDKPSSSIIYLRKATKGD